MAKNIDSPVTYQRVMTNRDMPCYPHHCTMIATGQ